MGVSSRSDFRSLRNSTRKRTPSGAMAWHAPNQAETFFSRLSGSPFAFVLNLNSSKKESGTTQKNRTLGDKAPLFWWLIPDSRSVSVPYVARDKGPTSRFGQVLDGHKTETGSLLIQEVPRNSGSSPFDSINKLAKCNALPVI